MITYSQVENLPEDHELYKQFMKELEDLDKMYSALGPPGSPGDDESSQDYFDRYIAGDR